MAWILDVGSIGPIMILGLGPGIAGFLRLHAIIPTTLPPRADPLAMNMANAFRDQVRDDSPLLVRQSGRLYADIQDGPSPENGKPHPNKLALLCHYHWHPKVQVTSAMPNFENRT